MSRRPRSYRDPTQRRATAEFALQQLAEVLKTVSEREQGVILMRFGLLDYEPKTWDEIGQRYGVTRERISQIEHKVMSKLRHPSRTAVLRDFLDDEGIAQLPDHVRARILGRPVVPAPPPRMVHCERHGWREVYSASQWTCRSCPCPLWSSWTGRTPIYCSSACRQAAYRQRRRATTARSAASAAAVRPAAAHDIK